MLKIFGSLIVIFATSIMGFYYANVFTERVKQLRELQYALNILETEIVYTSTPLIEALRNVSERCDSGIKKIFLLTSEKLKEKYSLGVLYAFKEAEKSLKGEIFFDKEEFEVLYSFMSTLGGSDVEGQKKIFNITVKKLEAFEKKAEDRRTKNEKLYRYLGVSAGMVIVILLV